MSAASRPSFVFLQGIRVRSGTNYLGQIAACHPDLNPVPPRREGKPTGELPLMRSLINERVLFDLLRKGYIGDEELDYATFARGQGDSLKGYIASTFDITAGTVFLKDPTTEGIDLFFDFFPGDKLIVLVRDGRDNTASAVKAGMSVRRGMPMSYEVRKRLNHLSLRDFRGHARQWASSARRILDFDAKHRGTEHAGKYLIVRYEDVFHDPRHWARKIFEFIGLSTTEEVIDAAADVGVVGSSFYSSGGLEDAVKPNWQPTPRSDAFSPVERWRNWSRFHKELFKRIAGDELIALGYAQDSRW